MELNWCKIKTFPTTCLNGLIERESRLYLPKPRFHCNFGWLWFRSGYSWEKEIKELSLSYLFLSPESMSYQSWKRGFGKFRWLSRLINRILRKVYRHLLIVTFKEKWINNSFMQRIDGQFGYFRKIISTKQEICGCYGLLWHDILV